MIRRIDQPDTKADIDLRACTTSKPPRSFIMVAGAGSGKTTSLIKGLSGILKTHGEHLRSRRQKVACITYTDIAAGEIWADVGNNPLVHVSTIHSFLWSTVKHFQPDIKNWVSVRIEEKIAELKEKAANFGSRVQQKTKDKNRRDTVHYENQRGRIQELPSFKYGTGSDYVSGILGHDDVIKIGTSFLTGRPLIRRLLSQQFPFLFVDESQDTFGTVVESLKAVGRAHKDSFCLGFFGDPMQQIYNTGIGAIPPDEGWVEITKPENFRCPQSILSVSNAIRRDGDGLKQIPGGKTGEIPGTAIFFIASTNADRDKTISKIRALVASETKDPEWASTLKNDPVKVLVIVHRMAAKRLGFGDIYSALNDKAPELFKNGFMDATAWPLRPFTSFLLPLVIEARAGNEFGVMEILRKHCKQLRPESIQKESVANVLGSLRKHTQHFQNLLAEDSKATVSDVLNYLREADLIELDPRLLSYVTEKEIAEEPAKEEQDQDEDELSKEIASMEAFLQCPARQFLGYYTYIEEQSPFSTQQGIKGAEFERVLVILDDDEGTHAQFSYDKYFVLKELSDKEQENRREGKETSIERTRRLFYVCCTRAKKDLVVVYFVGHPDAAHEKILALKLFPSGQVRMV